VQQYPNLESSSVIITTVYTGASAETIRGFLTTPIERVVSAISGVDHIESSSRAGLSTVTVRLKLNHSSTAALAEVTARLQQVRSELPEEAEPPVVEVQRADRPYASFYLSFTSAERSVPAVTDWLTRTLQPQFATLAGVQRVTIEGGRSIAMRVWIDPGRLAALNLSPGDVHAALQRNNYLAAVGRTKGNLVQVNLLANTDLRTTEEFKDLIVAERRGAIVRLSDVATVELGAEEAEMVAKYNGSQAVYLGIWPLVGSNEIEVARRLREEMERIRPTLPKDIDMRLVWDGTMFMRDALAEITKTLGETIMIVGLAVFLFMGSVRTALVPLLAMPVSLIGAALVMLAFGFSLNLLTILAIVLSVGLVVDDAIVVVENVERHVRQGKSRIEAAVAGARELIGPIIAMTITLAAVYAPIGFQGGLTGSLFLEFAITLAAAVVVSGFVAVTLSPVMSSRFVHPQGKEGRLTALVNRGFARVRRAYGWLLDRALEMRWAIVTAALLITLAAWPLYQHSRRELAPVEDQSHISLFLEASPDATLEAVNGESLEVIRGITAFPEAQFMWSLAAPWGGFGGMVTKDWKSRPRSTAQMYGDVFATVARVPGLRVFPRLDPPLPTPGQYDVELVLQSDGPTEELLRNVEAVVNAGSHSGKFLYVDSDLKIDLPQAHVVLDRERLSDLGLDLAGVGQELGTLLGGAYVNRFNYFDRSYKVIPQIGDKDRATLQPLLDLKIKTPSGVLVPVSTFTRIETTTAPRVLNRFQQRNAARVFGGLQAGITKEEGLRVLETAAAAAGGPGMTVDYAGESRQIRQEGEALTVTLGFALVLIYLVLSAQFQSFRDPLIVLVGSVPLAISGALVFTFLDLTTINIYSQVGLITLVGLVAKNGILIVEFANRLQERGLSKDAALREASLTRLRPVLMTSAATVFGHFPLVLVSGPGAAARNSIGTVLVSGMLLGTLFTLFVVPVFYALIAAQHRKTAAAEDRERLPRPVALPVGGGGRVREWRPAQEGHARHAGRTGRFHRGVIDLPVAEAETDTGRGLRHASGNRKWRARMRRWLITHLALFSVLIGCTLGPDYRRPETPSPAAWRDGRSDPASLAELAWWELFADEELRRLVGAALESNKDLGIALARVDQARAQVGIARAAQFPQVDAGAGATTNRFSENVPLRGQGGETELLTTTVDLNFEIDIWGRLRRASEAARAELLASEDARHTVVMTLVSDVAATYLQLRQLDLERETTQRSVVSRRDSLAIVRERVAAGLTSPLDLRQAEAALAGTAARIPDLERQIAQAENRLSILLGRAPGGIRRGQPLTGQAAPPDVPAGLPSALLERRPDIRQAEAGLVAANARIGVAKAAFFPRITLTGAFGVESEALADLFDGPSRIWRFGPGVTVPIFNAGRNRANLALAEARQRESLLRYEQAIQQAFREVEDALVAHRKAREALSAQSTAVQASREALSIAEFRYASGLSNYLDVLDAQRTLLTEEVAEGRTLLAQLVAVVQLYRALGGGWEAGPEEVRPAEQPLAWHRAAERR
jgi:multidrug efflux pump